MSDELIGKQLDEYRLEDLLGQGGMARVYRAIDVRLERQVAIKVIDASFRTDSDYMMRFEREAKAVAQLEHPHIVSLYRYGEIEGLLYMAMQYIEGSTLNALLASYRQEGNLMPVAEVHRVTQQVCQALDYAHSKGVIHRDIKPANIMLDKQGNAYLADFGLALIADVGTRGEIFGTPHYVAPEQAMSSAGVTPQSDLYAMGVILYEMLTGEVPFDAANAMDVALLHMSEPPPPPREINPELSPELEHVILKALEKEPANRYQSGSDLVKATDQALKAGSQVALPLPSPEMSIPYRVAAGLTERPLPPPPAGTPPLAATTPVEPLPAPSSAQAEAAPAKKRTLIFAGVGLGLLAAGALLLLLILVALFFFMRGRNDDQAAQASPPATVAVEATPTGQTETETNVPATEELPAAAAAVEATPTGQTETEANVPATAEPSAAALDNQPTIEATLPPTELPLTATATAEPLVYTLLIAKNKDDSLFVVNQGAAPFPLAALQLGSGDRWLNGNDWGVATLGNGECVSAWKDKGKPKAPDVTCNELSRLTLEGKQRFWKDAFEIRYQEQLLQTCGKDEKSCTVTITAEF
jgi:tRNA A-37 threonylcarbamoyl transferase component Bud32